MTIEYTPAFIRDYKRAVKKHLPIERLDKAISMLANGSPLPPGYHDHALGGGHSGKRECHILPNWLLVYRITNDRLTLVLLRTGTHDEVL